MQDANASEPRMYRFFRYVDDIATFQGLAIFLDEEIGLLVWPVIVGILAYQRLIRPTEQVLSSAIEPHKPQRLALLDEQHERNVFDNRVEECVGSLEFFLNAFAPGNIADDTL